ncbi:MAG TPA: DUF2339 domain-containing protein [Solirubrobacteraceae bacterium]
MTATDANEAREERSNSSKVEGQPVERQPTWKSRSGMSLSDVIGGQVLAWLGGAATLIGILLFLVLAVSHGWIGQETRVLLAAMASTALMGAGTWLHDRRGRTEAAIAMVGTATAGLFATLIVASEVYELLPELLAVLGAMLVGGVATVLAIRWAGRAIGALGLLGALCAGIVVGAPIHIASIALLAVTATCATWVAVKQRWGWLALGTVLICAPQLTIWILEGWPVPLEILVLAVFAALGLLGAFGAQLNASEERLAPAAAATATLSACVVAVLGWGVLAAGDSPTAGIIWLAALACVHVAIGARLFPRTARLYPRTAKLYPRTAGPHPRTQTSLPLRRLLLALGVMLADVAFALGAQGMTLALGWSASAVMLAWLARRSAHASANKSSSTGPGTNTSSNESLYTLGVGAQIGIALIQMLLDAPPSALASGTTEPLGLLSISALAASCIACGHLSASERTSWRVALNSLGLIAIAYLSASALDGATLVAAWALEGLALARVNARKEDIVSRYGACAFIGAAAMHTLLVEAPPTALSSGVANLGAAAGALGTLAAVGVRLGMTRTVNTDRRHWPFLGAAGALLYLASVATITAFTPTTAATGEALLELSVRQQGQVALSALWSLLGLFALILGLRRDIPAVRTAGLVLLLVAVAKVFLYDLSTLTSLYRVTSFTVLGLLLLSGALAYQRLRPPAPPDMRTVHPSQL